MNSDRWRGRALKSTLTMVVWALYPKPKVIIRRNHWGKLLAQLERHETRRETQLSRRQLMLRNNYSSHWERIVALRTKMARDYRQSNPRDSESTIRGCTLHLSCFPRLTAGKLICFPIRKIALIYPRCRGWWLHLKAAKSCWKVWISGSCSALQLFNSKRVIALRQLRAELVSDPENSNRLKFNKGLKLVNSFQDRD